MHEFAICERLVEIAIQEVARLQPSPRKVRTVGIAVGGLQQIVPETLETAFEVLTRGTPLEGATLRIRTVPVLVRCRDCRAESEIPPTEFICPQCGGVVLDVLAGREFVLETLEVDDS